MATTVHIRISSTDAPAFKGTPVNGGVSITVTGATYVYDAPLATATARTLWDASSDLPASWDVLYFQTDQALSLVFEGASGADNSTSLEIKAGGYLILTNNQILTYDADNRLDGTAEDIEVIKVKNASGSTANPYLLLID